MRRHACQGDIAVAVAKQGPCGMFHSIIYGSLFLGFSNSAM